ncbi:hypothetical protein O6H91_14G063900 [Diphasiastrum complanatum]|uniref:Uncharacterized protein n=1 Tax=Diphasiastrum complanatum TaxID=34168 RepID=A0ACC2BQW1_DIPCM|nr:hypothetical protein O6H91_14G063900 [Diphasiastrum complanatum]
MGYSIMSADSPLVFHLPSPIKEVVLQHVVLVDQTLPILLLFLFLLRLPRSLPSQSMSILSHSSPCSSSLSVSLLATTVTMIARKRHAQGKLATQLTALKRDMHSKPLDVLVTTDVSLPAVASSPEISLPTVSL